MASVLGLYVKRWQRWVAAGLQGIAIEHDPDRRVMPCPKYRRNTCSVYRRVITQRHKKIDRFAV
jgi:hypothetical protein